MAFCPAGHHTEHTDFCDVCGLPVTAPVESQPAVSTPDAPAALACPHCGASNVAEALFCESCGFDFTTGSLPAPQPAPQWPLPSPVADTNGSAQQDSSSAVEEDPPVLEIGDTTVVNMLAMMPAKDAADSDQKPALTVEWVAELWIDPDWYSAQGSSDPMPSPGLPDIVPLVKERSLIGRVSNSRGIFPEIDCDLDTGCSRRHALLTTDWSRWWIEDLGSANGTFVGAAAGPIPAMPIPQGKVELTLGQRIYLGAWTRIVIRPATQDEREAFGA